MIRNFSSTLFAFLLTASSFLLSSTLKAQSGTENYKSLFHFASQRTLPVKYMSFTAKATEKATLIEWTTSESAEHSYYEVERSFNGESFSKAAIALDGFENGTEKNYAFKDNAPALKGQSVVYYRLKQFNTDGQFTYSNTITARFAKTAGVAMQVSPNPFSESINFNLAATEIGNSEIRIVNINGETVHTSSLGSTKGTKNIRVKNLGHLPAGMYTALLMVNGKIISSQKIIK